MTATKFSFIQSVMSGSTGKFLRMDYGWDSEFNPQTSWFGVDTAEHTGEEKAALIATTLATQGHIVSVGTGYAHGSVFEPAGTSSESDVVTDEPKSTDPVGTWVPVSEEQAGSLSLADLIALAVEKHVMTGLPLTEREVFEDDAEYTAYLIAYVTEGGENIVLVDPSH